MTNMEEVRQVVKNFPWVILKFGSRKERIEQFRIWEKRLREACGLEASEKMKKICEEVNDTMNRETSKWILNLHSHFLFKPEIRQSDICYNAKRLCHHCDEPECDFRGMNFKGET